MTSTSPTSSASPNRPRRSDTLSTATNVIVTSSSDLVRNGAFRLPVAKVLKSDTNADVALLRLAARPTEFQNNEFFPLEQARSTKLPHTAVMVSGFRPTLPSYVANRRRCGVLPHGPGEGSQNRARERFGPGASGLSPYTLDEGQVMGGHGRAGRGLDASEIERESVESRGPPTHGLQVGYFEKTAGRPLVAPRIEEVTPLLAE